CVQLFQRRQRAAELGNKFCGEVEFIVGNQPARIAAVKLIAIVAKSRQRLCKTVAAGAWARTAQQRAFQRGDGGAVGTGGGAQPQQRMLEQRQQRDRFEAAKGGLRRQPREHTGRRVGQRIAAGIIDRYAPALQRSDDAARQRAVGRHQRGGFVLGLNRFAQTNGNSERFFLGIGGFDHRKRFQRVVDCGLEVLFSGACLPTFGGGGWT